MGIAEKLGISRQSTFIATVTVHELLQVPLVTAKFRVKWKFKGSTSHTTNDGADSSDEGDVNDGAGGTSSKPQNSSGIKNGLLHPLSAVLSHTSSSSSSDPHENTTGRSSTSPSRAAAGNETRAGSTPTFSLSPPMSPDHMYKTPNPNKTPTASFGFTSPFGSSHESMRTPSDPTMLSLSQSPSPEETPPSRRRGATTAAALSHLHHVNAKIGGGSGGSGGASSSKDSFHLYPNNHSRAEAKGMTTLIPLRSHTATFNREIHCPVLISLKHVPGTNSARYALQPSPLKLTIRQEVIGDSGKKEEVKTGEVVLDLSQFVRNKSGSGSSNKNGSGATGTTTGAAPTARRYLLKDCKTNAVLKVTVKMEWVGGEAHYVAPPLRSGQLHSMSSSQSLSSSSTSSFNRSSTSILASRREPGSGQRSAAMSRTNSASSMLSSQPAIGGVGASNLSSRNPSMTSLKDMAMTSTSSSGQHHQQSKKKGWRPTNAANFSTSSTSAITGRSANMHDQGAYDIVETLFNRPVRQGSWSMLATPTLRQTKSYNGQHGGQSDSSPQTPYDENGPDELSFSAGRSSQKGKKGVMKSSSSGQLQQQSTNISDDVDDSHDSHDSRFKIASTFTSRSPHHPSNFNASHYQRPGPPSRQPSSEEGVLYLSEHDQNKNRSIRWDESSNASEPRSSVESSKQNSPTSARKMHTSGMMKHRHNHDFTATSDSHNTAKKQLSGIGETSSADGQHDHPAKKLSSLAFNKDVAALSSSSSSSATNSHSNSHSPSSKSKNRGKSGGHSHSHSPFSTTPNRPGGLAQEKPKTSTPGTTKSEGGVEWAQSWG